MPEIVEERSVEAKGKGKPDYQAVSRPGRTEVQEGQEEWSLDFETDIDANSTIEMSPIYTVPSGKNLIVGYMKGSFSKDGIYPSTMLKNGETRCPFYVYGRFVAVPGPAGGFVFRAGDSFGFRMKNPYSESVSTRGDFSGFLHTE